MQAGQDIHGAPIGYFQGYSLLCQFTSVSYYVKPLVTWGIMRGLHGSWIIGNNPHWSGVHLVFFIRDKGPPQLVMSPIFF